MKLFLYLMLMNMKFPLILMVKMKVSTYNYLHMHCRWNLGCKNKITIDVYIIGPIVLQRVKSQHPILYFQIISSIL